MRETKIRNTENRIAVDIEGLSAMLSCGNATARKIGEDARARITIGRRVLYSVSKVERYLNEISIQIIDDYFCNKVNLLRKVICGQKIEQLK